MNPLHSLIHRNLPVLPPSATLQEAAREICNHPIGCVLVAPSNKDHAGGIVTDWDLTCSWASDSPASDRSVSEIMTTDLICADETAELKDILALMETHGVRKVPLINEKQEFTGVITLDDLIAAELVEPPRLARIARRQAGRRIRKVERASFHAHLAQGTGLSADLLPPITQFILSSVAMRISMTAATHFISQLPKRVREPLQKLPPGPEPTISSRAIVEELVDRFHLTENYARTILHRFLFSLSTWIGSRELENLRFQLPEDFLPYFTKIVPLSESQASAVLPHALHILSISSSAFPDGGEIPKRYTGDGADRSPPIVWSGVPFGTQEFALICEDLDAKPGPPEVHWVIYGISGTVTKLSEGLPQIPEIQLPVFARQGKTTAGTYGYRGPLPPLKDRRHRYSFHIYALDHEILLPAGATAEELREEMEGHILGEGVLIGRYRRNRKMAA